MTFLGTLALATRTASACGGFACDNVSAPPVLQAAERIVFGIDPDTDEVEMHVQISYTGSHDFAWIVPVPEVPNLELSTSALFTQIATVTQPTFTLLNRDEGRCRDEARGGSYKDASYAFDATSSSGDDDDSGDFYDVTVAETQTVGPYDTVTLRGASSEDVLGWLREQGYALPNNLGDLVDQYVADDAWFVALKLKTGSSTGDLAPLAMKFHAGNASIPVQLTSISATPDMRMEVYVFSDGRAVPESYLHVRINDAAINWWKGGNNYRHVVTQAANEAGGHAFATDYHGPSTVVPPFAFGGDWPVDALRSAAGRREWLQTLRGSLLTVPPELYTVLEDVFVLPTGQGQVMWGCPSCVTPGSGPFHADEATDEVVERVFQPLDAAQGLLDRFPNLSRLTSSMDAVEMTVDPVFVVNQDQSDDQVSQARTADYVWECNGRKRTGSRRRLGLADGREIELPSQDWLADRGLTEFQWMHDLGDIKAQIIEQDSAEGEPEVLVDHTADLFDLVAAHNRGLGCGCSTGGSASTGALGGLALALGLARRRGRQGVLRPG